MMANETTSTVPSKQSDKMRRYYRWHAAWYDATRWTFLFGRDKALRMLRLDPFSEETILEVGCGTGRNLSYIAQYYVQVHLIGVDVSPEMLQKADQNLERFDERVSLFERPYAPGTFPLPHPADRILCSYALSMFNPGWEEALQRAAADLSPTGKIVVVDFHQSPLRWFTWWMGKNHVRMDGHLLAALKEYFEEQDCMVKKAWFGLYQYFIFTGTKKQAET